MRLVFGGAFLALVAFSVLAAAQQQPTAPPRAEGSGILPEALRASRDRLTTELEAREREFGAALETLRTQADALARRPAAPQSSAFYGGHYGAVRSMSRNEQGQLQVLMVDGTIIGGEAREGRLELRTPVRREADLALGAPVAWRRAQATPMPSEPPPAVTNVAPPAEEQPATRLASTPAPADPIGVSVGPALAQIGDRSFEGSYAVFARGMEAGVFTFNFSQSGDNYQIGAERRSTGLAATLLNRSQDYTYSVQGTVAAENGLQPSAYQHQGGRRREDRPNGRLVRATFSADDVTTTSEPAGMGMGEPPATAQQRRNVIDQLTAIATLITASGDPCSRTLRVYMDGRSRFDFVLTPNGRVNVSTSAYRGEALRCSVAFRPIAGFSDPQEQATLTFLFAQTASGLYAPVQIEMPTIDTGVVRLQARALRVNGEAVN